MFLLIIINICNCNTSLNILYYVFRVIIFSNNTPRFEFTLFLSQTFNNILNEVRKTDEFYVNVIMTIIYFTFLYVSG